ncbi:hypothetical protein PSN45_004889 [Yamadazyma tenuis]|uniref:Cytochrome P450 n=1 Tax=Candida tenuis (strain ATCC 10573 / BCRC 21748 / CBS 615 / JCM 9827 / NBRC 10315 / NRRL Y-1498 / VKM Y-70) TaxID=590646 RepID=G3B201_CANTC|nr:cytochrome P450 [Yamadazyma tenuis ATCC 10573]EGV64571.1 cytochrome P450 [Yamadazyma tenuis ATCC 10573]WEJ97339.1 hypothetical protein PSN45_004889 [Yamadazyma tenuis]
MSMFVGIYLLTTYIIFYVVRHLYQDYLAQRWGCEPISRLNTNFCYNFFGFGDVKRILMSLKGGYSLYEESNQLNKLGLSTYETMVLGQYAIVTANPENAKAMMASQVDEFSIGVRSALFKDVLGQGIFTVEGKQWKHSRETIRPSFGKSEISHVAQLEPHFKKFTDALDRCMGQTVDVQPLLSRLAWDASSELLFGGSIGSLDMVDGTLKNDGFDECFITLQKYNRFRFLLGKYCWLVNPPARKQAVSEIKKFTQFYVQKALSLSKQDLENKSTGESTFLYDLAKTSREPKFLQDEILSIMLAGRGTTSSLMTFAIFELSRNPEIWRKLSSIVHEQFGDGSNLDLITFESIKKCQYLKFCLNETLRLHPPVSTTVRQAKKNTVLPHGGGADGLQPIFVPKATNVVLRIFALHRMEKFYGPNATDFIPERWENIRPGWAFVPFLGGPRVCLGQQLALTEAGYIIIRLAQTYREFVNMDPQSPPPLSVGAVSKLKRGVLVQAKK